MLQHAKKNSLSITFKTRYCKLQKIEQPFKQSIKLSMHVNSNLNTMDLDYICKFYSPAQY